MNVVQLFSHASREGTEVVNCVWRRGEGRGGSSNIMY